MTIGAVPAEPTCDPGSVRTVDQGIGRTAVATRAERRAAGRAHREAVPLESHATVPARDERVDPIALLVSQDATRLADLVPIRHGRMSATPFTFYRGAAAVMAADLSASTSTSLEVQLCGDAHLSNFGVFNGPDRRLVFDLNDFDETHPGPFEWDVKRLAASVTVAARNNGLSDAKARAATLATVAGYRSVLTAVARVDPLALHYHRVEFDMVLERLDAKARKRGAKAARKAAQKNSLRAFDKLTTEVDGQRRVVDDPPLVTRLGILDGEQRSAAHRFFELYLESLPLARRRLLERYRLVDVARKVVGVGSVGTRCLIVLLTTGDGEPLFLQFKEATSSVLEAHLARSEFAHHGQRVVEGQRLMQATGDVFLGWASFEPPDQQRVIDFYFRQLWDGKASADIDAMRGRGLALYGELCGRALALAHARTGDAALISGYLGDEDTFDHAVSEFASAYADITEADHKAHLRAIRRGQIEVVRG